MPNLPISQLPVANPLTGPELFAAVQDGITKQTTFDSIFDGISGSVVLTSSFNSYTSSVQSYYLSAYHTASMTAPVVDTGYTMSFSTTDFSYGISISGSGKNLIKIDNTGIYDIQFSAQLDKTTSTNATVYIWLAKNGSNVPDSNTGVTLGGGANDSAVAAWNFYISASAGDYYELRYGATRDNTRILYNPSPSVGPAIPSVILTVGRIG